jgi:hypothetical protein
MTGDWRMILAPAILLGGAGLPEKPCLTPTEAQSLVMTALPDAVVGAQMRCRTALPATAALIQAGGVISARWRSESTIATDDANRAIDKISRIPISSMLGAEAARQAIRPTILREVSKRLATYNCVKASEILDALSPLPVRNVARALLALGVSQTEADGLPFSLCKAA